MEISDLQDQEAAGDSLEAAADAGARVSCVLADLESEDEPEGTPASRADWLARNLDDLVFESAAVAEAGAREALRIDYSGIYFLIWRGQVCYVGQARNIATRIDAHAKERRPFDGIAAIVGVPAWALDVIEYAYILGWSPPWNAESTRSGALSMHPDFAASVAATDRSKVAEWITPRTRGPAVGMKAWQLHVLAVSQHTPSG